MPKTEKELAFLRDLYIAPDWTRRFTELIDKHFEFSNEENLLYINAGTGVHTFVLRDRLDNKTHIFATCETNEMLNIAQEKAAAIRSNVEFSRLRFENDTFDTVLADASFLQPADYGSMLEETTRVARSGADIGILSVTSGSFGEIFSLLWEVLFNEDLCEHGAEAEKMITELPTVSRLEEIARSADLENVKTHTSNEVFEYANGSEFINSPLVSDFLLPVWLRMLDEKDRARVTKKLEKLIDQEDGSLSFRFTVKATLLKGEKR